MNYVEVDGVLRTERTTVYAVLKPERAVTVSEVALFESEFEGRYMIGGMLLEKPKEPTVVTMPKFRRP